MAKAKKKGAKPAKGALKSKGPLELSWNLAELPSSQHKTGLAGLVLMVRWLGRQPKRKGICELARIDADGATLRIDEEGMRELFDETYAASTVEREQGRNRKDKKKDDVALLRTIAREVTDGRGKAKTKTFRATVPRGAFLADLDAEKSGLWIKMWRSFLWSVVRARSTTRKPYESRAARIATADAEDAFAGLESGADKPTKLPSTYFVGAQEKSAENVPFRDRTRLRFLLHFWPFAVGLYVPCILDGEGKREIPPNSYALVFADLADLATWCDEYYRVLEGRGEKAFKYLPVEAVIDLPAEGALDLAGRLYQRLAVRQGSLDTSDLVLGLDVVHVEHKDKNVRVRSSMRVEPTLAMTEEYERLKGRFTDPLFRRQILANHLAGRPPTDGFDRLFATHAYERFLARDRAFQDDARQFFSDEREVQE